ncbi:lipopolysaccharide biosynthesis protein [Pseudomonas shahriarae]|uniref:lipopolysaccharide biosynthesis protein n=1 Tax=Pseudomonas shahriarae TaxID=2745512 RepID=UPI002360B66F|nr:oligosaccharide flippase family protein [Pseudomonas shahriarae]MDD0982933.1 oligosaccharide flippase family protein [Pseudomonas shahriarae]
MSVIGRMLMLYAGRSSSLLVAFVFLPLYSRMLGASQFGSIAVILSFQALLVMMDLGMSTLLGREVSVSNNDRSTLVKLLRSAELSLSGFYGILIFCALCLKFSILSMAISWSAIVAVVLLFWLLVLQNLYYSMLIADRRYILGSTLQVMGVTLRAGVTALALYVFSATLDMFIYTQLAVTILHWWISRSLVMKNLSTSAPTVAKEAWPTLLDAFNLTKAGGALVLFSAAGAAVTQLDKPVISMFISAASVAPYYLASLLCMAPISILAGPVSQYFQPLLLRAAASGVRTDARKIIARFSLSVFLVTALPTFILWWFREPIIELWVGPGPNNELISTYLAILLPGVAIGAFGFIPYSLLIYAKDFRFQATMSALLTVVTLAMTVLAASREDIKAICYVYSAYHASSTILSWFRAMTLTDVKVYARVSALLVLSAVFMFVAVVGLLFFLLV